MDGKTSSPDHHADYFDEAYFQRGWERGTAYVNYREQAEVSPIFSGIAKALLAAFTPANALEIGCATGAIVKHLNGLGVTAHGIDVSEWAVRNAAHPNVMLASAADLPFATGSFDLVYSAHALEHLPQDVYAAAFREMDRVASPDAVQFHMLPIVGTYPYDYDEAAAIRSLQADPTHVLLKRMEWWLDQWSALGWEPIGSALLLPADTDNVELSSGQFCLVRNGSSRGHRAQQGIDRWNALAFRQVTIDRQAARKVQHARVSRHVADRALPAPMGPDQDRWDDFKCVLPSPADLTNARIDAIVQVDGPASVDMRIALICRDGGVQQKWLVFPPGTSFTSVDVGEFVVEAGDGSLTNVDQILFGGHIGDFRISANMAVNGPHADIAGVFDPSD